MKSKGLFGVRIVARDGIRSTSNCGKEKRFFKCRKGDRMGRTMPNRFVMRRGLFLVNVVKSRLVRRMVRMNLS